MTRAYDDAFQVGAVGKTVTTGAASANTALPTDSAGNPPKFVRIAASGPCYVKFGVSGVVATTNDIQIVGAYPEVYAVKGNDFFGYLQLTGAQTLNVTPLEG